MELSDSKSPFEYTPEQVQVLQRSAGEPLHIAVKENDKVYLVIEQGVIPSLDEDYIRRGLAKAAESIASGDVREWDVEKIKATGRELLAERQRQK